MVPPRWNDSWSSNTDALNQRKHRSIWSKLYISIFTIFLGTSSYRHSSLMPAITLCAPLKVHTGWQLRLEFAVCTSVPITGMKAATRPSPHILLIQPGVFWHCIPVSPLRNSVRTLHLVSLKMIEWLTRNIYPHIVPVYRSAGIKTQSFMHSTSWSFMWVVHTNKSYCALRLTWCN